MDSQLKEAVSRMILSASGWRGIFAENGDEENAGAGISEAHRIIAAAAAKVFSDYLSITTAAAAGKNAVIAGRDTRPTGEAIADTVIRALLAEGREVLYIGIAASPEIMAFARSLPAAGFIYISASHNPIGHNGIKFGLGDGGVLQADEAAKLVAGFQSFMASPERIERARSLLKAGGTENPAPEALSAVYAAMNSRKKAALAAYRDFTAGVISGFSDRDKSYGFFAFLKKGLEKRPLRIAVDFNGSARTVSIDREFFSSLGVGFRGLNETPGGIAHRIVPEGESLEPCRVFAEELSRKDPSLVLGYMPDCDGDRGNLVYAAARTGGRKLEAQEVFALACAAELSFLVWKGELKYSGQGKALTRTAVAVNDSTSLRIDRIAEAFDVSVFRAETGEANVVGLARRLREQGYLVKILGEGSAGGTIIHPSAVRDPVDTIGAILKLLAIRGGGEHGPDQGLFEIWCGLSDQAETYREDFTLADVIASLPAFSSTGAYSEDALLKIKTADHGLLKERYQKIFLREWEEKKNMLHERFGLTGWQAIAYNGMDEKRGISRFSEAGQGGLKIEFTGEGAAAASIWMRGSKTEPVFRVMADAAGADTYPERTLIEWQRQMVLEADGI